MRFSKIAVTVFLVCAALAPWVQAQDGVVTWKIASLAPQGMGWAKHAGDVMIKGVSKATDNHLQFAMHWGGIMGDDEDYLAKMRIGQLDGAGLSGQGAALACPEFAVVEMPFLFRDYDEVDYVRAKMFGVFDQLFAKRGLKLIYWVDQDFDQIYSVQPLASLEDFAKARFVLWYGPLEESTFCALDADSTPLNVPESSAALRSGLVNATIAPAAWMVGAQLQSVVKFVNPVRIRYSPVAIVCTQEAWQSLPGKYRQACEKDRDATAGEFLDLVRKDNQRCLEALKAYGVQETIMTPENLQALQKAVGCVRLQMADIAYPAALLREVEGHLAAFRAFAPTE